MATLVYCFCPSSSSSLPSNKKQWNFVVKQHVLEGNSYKAILMYTKMLESGFNGDNFTYPILLKASTHLSSSQIMIPLHAQAIKTGFTDHVFVETALLSAYAALGYVENAQKLFDKMSKRDLIAWNSMLDVYASAGQMENAIKHFNLLPVKDTISFNIMISGYAKIGSVESAREIFHKIPVRDIASWNSMIFAYSKAGEVENACKLFDKMMERNLVSWNTMINGYLDNELYTDAINLFFEMKERGVEPNHITLASVLSACAHIGSIEKGREIHIYTGLIGLALDTRVVTALIDMYAKCGNINGALQVFYKSQVKDITCWNAMISGLALHGYACSALKLFDDLQNRNMKPDDITFIGILTACSHAGLIDEGRHLFESMEKDYGIRPKLEHYGCMVDLFGRANFLQSAYRLIKVMPFEPGVAAYGALLGACVVHRNLEMGKIVAEHIARVNCLSDGEYMMLANMYASCGKWEEANGWRQKMNDARIRKTAGYSTIEVNGRMFKFLAGEIEQIGLDKQ